MRLKWLPGIICLFFLWLTAGLEAGPVITAKNGILYQDGKPCFLVGVCYGTGYAGGFSIHPQSPAKVEVVAGREGKGLKISFPAQVKVERSSRWIDFPGFDPQVCVVNKARFLKLWVKGDGSNNVIKFKIENYSGGKTLASTFLGEFTLTDTGWKQFVFPLEDKYSVLAQANASCLILPWDKVTPHGFSYTLDDITIDGPNGEMLLCDFDNKWPTSNLLLLDRNGKEEFREDPVYRAIWDDPLYKEVSRENFQIIGMNTYHFPASYIGSILSRGDVIGDGYLCEKLDGMPLIPEFTFTYGAYYGGQGAENWAKNAGLPPTILRRNPGGSPAGGFDALCFEDPLGHKVHQEAWQEGVRNVLQHRGNPYAYELINENSGEYGDACAQNKAEFIRRLREKYRDDIASLNKDWGTTYENFDAIHVQIPQLGSGSNKIKGLTVEWNKFMEDRYVEILQQGGKWIHQVEDQFKRPHGLMGQMGYPYWDFYGSGGTDMYKMARGFDCLQTEAGVNFGGKEYAGEVNPLTAVLAIKGGYSRQMNMDLMDSICPDKPIINTENYIIRYKGEARQPTTKADVITSLWEEFLRGVSAVHTYAWQPHYATRDEALAEGARNQRLLSPYLYPRESLNGYQEVNQEIGRVAAIVMERPRLGRDAEVAVLFSRPTARYLMGVPGWHPDFGKMKLYRSQTNLYEYLMENHLPMRYVYEEQLPEGKASKYRLILAPLSDNIYPGTINRLSDYVRKGGTLVCFGDGFLCDEYGNERYGRETAALLGAERKKVNDFVQTVEIKGFGSVKASGNRLVVPDAAKVLAVFPETGAPFITVNNLGKGKVYYVNLETWRFENNGEIAPILDFLTNEAAVRAPLQVVSPEGIKATRVEANVIEKGKKEVIFLVNWVPYLDRVVKVRLRNLNDKDNYYLVDIAKNSLYAKEGRQVLTGKELKDGINLLLPSQERVVLLLTKERYRTPNQPLGLLSDQAAVSLDKELRNELEQALAGQAKDNARTREMVIGFPGFTGDYENIQKCIRAAAGDAIEAIKLVRTNSSSDIRVYGLRDSVDSVLTYQFIYKNTLLPEEIEKIQTKVLEALVGRYKPKVIKTGLKR